MKKPSTSTEDAVNAIDRFIETMETKNFSKDQLKTKMKRAREAIFSALDNRTITKESFQICMRKLSALYRQLQREGKLNED